MSFTIKSLHVNSTDNIHTLAGKIYIPEGQIKGLFHIVHGMTEYIGRYDHVMSAIAEKGYVCFGYDNLGHGQTVKNDSELGFIAHVDGWKYLIDDVNAFEQAVIKMYPDKSLTLMGHSMGSFISRLAAEKFSKNFSKLIICGTAGSNPLLPIALFLTDLIKSVRGEKYISQFINKMAFGAYDSNFEEASKYNWLTKEQDIVKKYEKDKYCNYDFTVSAMHDLVKLMKMCNRPNWFLNLRDDLPVLLISGADDPVGNFGRGVEKVYEKLLKAGKKDVTLKLYQNCRHEIHNDTCKDEVIRDILRFIKK